MPRMGPPGQPDGAASHRRGRRDRIAPGRDPQWGGTWFAAAGSRRPPGVLPILLCFAWGHGGQFLFAIPTDDLVVVHLARRYPGRETGIAVPQIARLLDLSSPPRRALSRAPRQIRPATIAGPRRLARSRRRRVRNFGWASPRLCHGPGDTSVRLKSSFSRSSRHVAYLTGEKDAGINSLFSWRTGRTPACGGHAPPGRRDSSERGRAR